MQLLTLSALLALTPLAQADELALVTGEDTVLSPALTSTHSIPACLQDAPALTGTDRIQAKKEKKEEDEDDDDDDDDDDDAPSKPEKTKPEKPEKPEKVEKPEKPEKVEPAKPEPTK